MAPFKFINLLAISSLAVLACSFGATPVTALVTDTHHIRDISVHGHGAMAKRKRATSNTQRCKNRPSSTHPKATPKPSPKSDPAPTTLSSHSKPSPTPSSSGGEHGKVGLAWANGPSMDLKPFVNKNVQYVYTWSPNKIPQADALGLTSMVMLWGDKQISEFQALVKKGYAHCVMGANEPDQGGESNMSPAHGAELWIKYIQPLWNEGYDTFIAPTTSSAPAGMTWVKDWFKACNGQCRVTHMGVHYYDITAAGFIAYMKLWHITFNKPIMATEFACQNFNGGAQCSKNEVEAFMSEAVAFMEATDWVTAYFAFGVMKDMQGVNTLNQLMTQSGEPTSLGFQYLNP